MKRRARCHRTASAGHSRTTARLAQFARTPPPLSGGARRERHFNCTKGVWACASTARTSRRVVVTRLAHTAEADLVQHALIVAPVLPDLDVQLQVHLAL